METFTGQPTLEVSATATVAMATNPGTCGTVFKMTPTGAFSTLHIFNYTDGGNPGAAPIQASDGNFYGSTSTGGSVGSGTVFKITSTGRLTTVHNLDPKNGDGAFPERPVQHSNGIFYGLTVRGGKIVYHFCPAWCGTLFSLSVPLLQQFETDDGVPTVVAG